MATTQQPSDGGTTDSQSSGGQSPGSVPVGTISVTPTPDVHTISGAPNSCPGATSADYDTIKAAFDALQVQPISDAVKHWSSVSDALYKVAGNLPDHSKELSGYWTAPSSALAQTQMMYAAGSASALAQQAALMSVAMDQAATAAQKYKASFPPKKVVTDADIQKVNDAFSPTLPDGSKGSPTSLAGPAIAQLYQNTEQANNQAAQQHLVNFMTEYQGVHTDWFPSEVKTELVIPNDPDAGTSASSGSSGGSGGSHTFTTHNGGGTGGTTTGHSGTNGGSTGGTPGGTNLGPGGTSNPGTGTGGGTGGGTGVPGSGTHLPGTGAGGVGSGSGAGIGGSGVGGIGSGVGAGTDPFQAKSSFAGGTPVGIASGTGGPTAGLSGGLPSSLTGTGIADPTSLSGGGASPFVGSGGVGPLTAGGGKFGPGIGGGIGSGKFGGGIGSGKFGGGIGAGGAGGVSGLGSGLEAEEAAAGAGARGLGGPGAAGAAGAGRGGMMPMMGGAHGNEKEERGRKTWLNEDDDMWGGDADAAPTVIT